MGQVVDENLSAKAKLSALQKAGQWKDAGRFEDMSAANVYAMEQDYEKLLKEHREKLEKKSDDTADGSV